MDAEEIITLSSKTAIPMPLAAPEPASPMKWPLPMLLANSDAPTYVNIIISHHIISYHIISFAKALLIRSTGAPQYSLQLVQNKVIKW